MRTLLLVAFIAALTPLVSATAEGFAVALYENNVAVLSWAPIVEADRYDVYRGPSPDTLERIGSTRLPFFVDGTAGPEFSVYVITWESVDASGVVWSTNSGGPYCIRLYDGLRFSVNVKNCIMR